MMSTIINDKLLADLACKKLLDNLQNDLKTISNEIKKKLPQLKQCCEDGIVRIRKIDIKCTSSKGLDLNKEIINESPELMEPFFMGINSKIPKIIQISLTAIQRLITHQLISVYAAEMLLNCLWNLMENGLENEGTGLEELKILQTITLLISTNTIVQEQNLAKSIALCFRLHFTKNQTINNTASATIRQLVSVIFERVIAEDLIVDECQPVFEICYDELKNGSKNAPRSLKVCAADAFLLLQDLIQLVNADQPFWLNGLTEMTRTFGLELLESIFNDYPEIFNKHEEFSFLLKERVCPLVIKLFSPNLKYKQIQKQLQQQQQFYNQHNNLNTLANSNDKPFFPISIRLLRILNVIITKYYAMLITESEIFLSLLIKFLENDKPNWQRAVALEVLYKLCTQPNLIKSFCLFYDMKPNSSKILKDLSNALGIYTQSSFIASQQNQNNNLLSNIIGSNNQTPNGSNLSLNTNASSTSLNTQNTNQSNTNLTNSIQNAQPSFYFKGQWFPILNSIKHKSIYLDQLDKMDVPSIADGFGLSTSYFCIYNLVKCILFLINNNSNLTEINDQQNATIKKSSSSSSLSNGSIIKLKIDENLETIKKLDYVKKLDEDTLNLNKNLLTSTWTGIYAVFSLLLEASTDEEITDQILDLIKQLIEIYGIYNLKTPREAMINCLCKASLPSGYNLPELNFTIPLTSGSGSFSSHVNRTPTKVINSSAPIPGSSINLTDSGSKLTSNLGNGNDSLRSNYLTQLSSNATVLQQQQINQLSTSNLFSSPINNTSNSSSSTNANNNTSTTNSQINQNDLFDFKQQVVAVGTAFPHLYSNTITADSNSSSTTNLQQQAPTSVMLTAKNLQVMKQLLKVAHLHGIVLKENWYTILLTLQHLVWILGLKATTGGSLKSSKQNSNDSNSNSLITTAAMSDLPMLTTMLSRLFENSQQLDDESLIFLVTALCRLSKESMEIAYNNRELSLFAISKLLETGLVNLHRYKIYWNQMTNHLLVVCQHPQIKMREYGTETLTTLIKTALQTSEKLNKESIEETLNDNSNKNDEIDNISVKKEEDEEDRNVTFLRPLQSLSEIVFADIRQRQLDCCLQILQTSGDTIVAGWPQILAVPSDIISCINKLSNESLVNLIRLAFQCLQLIISDLLSQIPSECLVLLVNTTEKFASQCIELNVSLTAIGLLWNIADFFHQNRDKIKDDLKDFKLDISTLNLDKDKIILKPFECLWMCLFSRLGDLCIDERPSIRKSASQTLFHTLNTHANILDAEIIWSSILWQVLFPLLERVHTISINASNNKIIDVSKSMGISGIGVNGNSNPLMLHHSRNTSYKQWAETEVLTLAGISHVFSEKRHILIKSLDFKDFSDAWSILLKHIEQPALSRNCEVSLNALNCFQEILYCNKQIVINKVKENEGEDEECEQLRLEFNSAIDNDKMIILWKMAWEVWYTIGLKCFNRNQTNNNSESNQLESTNSTPTTPSTNYLANEFYAPSQSFLTSLIQIFPRLYENIKYDFNVDDFNKLSAVLENAISVPIDLSTQAYLMSANVQATNNYEYLITNSQQQQLNSSSSVTKQSTYQCSNGHTQSNCTSTPAILNQQLVPLTPLQDSILCIMDMFQTDLFSQLSNKQNCLSSTDSIDLKNSEELLTCIFSQLLTFTTYACQPPILNSNNQQNVNGNYSTSGKSLLISSSSLLNKYQNTISQQPVDWIIMNFIPFAERCLKNATQLYSHCATWPCVIKFGIMHAFIKTLRIPLTLKYNCLSQSTWLHAIHSLITVLQIGLPVARKNAKEFSTIWADLALCLEGYLFPNSSPLMVSVEEQQKDELLDVRLVHIIRDNILPFANEMPKVFVLQIVSILNRGSIHSATSISPVDTESSRKLREEFAKTCFETLLQFSFFGPNLNPNLFIQCSTNQSTDSNTGIGLVNKLAVTSLLQRFNDVIKNYVEDEKLSGKCPLPRHRMAEISFVLKALATLISSLKKAQKETVEKGVWEQIIELYPHLVDCTMSNSVQVNHSLREVLNEYKDLLQPFKYKKQQLNGN